MTGQPMARARSLAQFQAEFANEAACAAFLLGRRWPDGFVCPVCGKGRAAALGLHLRMLELRSSDFDHGGDGDAPHQAAADDMVLGGTSHGDAFQWHVGAAVGGSARLTYRTAWLLTQKLRRSMVDPD